MESRNTNASSLLRGLDWPTVIIYVLLVLCGVVSIYAASYDFDNASMFSFDEFSGKQLRWVGLAFLAGAMIMLIDFRVYEAYAYPIYGVVILLLIVTIFIAPDIKGSRSWLVLGPMSLQPAEFGKFATALALAKLFSSYNFSLMAARSISYVMVRIISFVARRREAALSYRRSMMERNSLTVGSFTRGPTRRSSKQYSPFTFRMMNPPVGRTR